MTVSLAIIREIFRICFIGTKFVIKRVDEDNSRKQFLILEGEVILAFVQRGVKFSQCASYKDISREVDCQVQSPSEIEIT